jgi:hypothetical protein
MQYNQEYPLVSKYFGKPVSIGFAVTEETKQTDILSIHIVLASLGVGLLFFSLMSLGYARSSEQDAAVLDQAVSGLARSLQPNSRFGDRIWKALSVPINSVVAATSYFVSTVLLPFQFVQNTIARIENIGRAAGRALEGIFSWTSYNTAAVLSYFGRNGKAVENALRAAALWVSRNVEAIVSFIAHYGGATINAVGRSVSFLIKAPETCSTWLSKAIAIISLFAARFGSTAETIIQSMSWSIAGVTDAASRQACSLRASPEVSGVIEHASAILLFCQQSLASFAILATGNKKTKRND